MKIPVLKNKNNDVAFIYLGEDSKNQTKFIINIKGNVAEVKDNLISQEEHDPIELDEIELPEKLMFQKNR